MIVESLVNQKGSGISIVSRLGHLDCLDHLGCILSGSRVLSDLTWIWVYTVAFSIMFSLVDIVCVFKQFILCSDTDNVCNEEEMRPELDDEETNTVDDSSK